MPARCSTRILSALCLLLVARSDAPAAEPLAFRVKLDPQVAQRPISGRLFVFLAQQGRGEPRLGPNWFRPEPFFGWDVKDVRPAETRQIDDRADAFPEKLSKLPPGEYRVQALLDHHPDCPRPGTGEGNFYSDVQTLRLDPAASGPIELVLDRVVPSQPFPESEWVKEVAVRSELLSKFHNREVIQRAAIALPSSYYEQPNRRYPTIYSIPGFGGGHRPRGAAQQRPAEKTEQVEFIRVTLNPQCKWGHHVFANSCTNGPRGDALIKELIPHIDRTYRTIPAATARLLTGHSSGGWSSLWLQVSYPDEFGGVWSIAPDPVDFRDFQQVNLYADPPLSLYFDPQGNRRPIARRGTTPFLWYESFVRMDDCLGRGGQMRSFEAVFSPLGPDGLPQKLWDRETGRVDPEVARAWKKYDVRLLLEENWETLGPKLQGKLHVLAGELDTFYLEGAVELLAETLRRLGSDAQIEIVPGKNHGNVLFPNRGEEIRRQMAETFLRHHPRDGEHQPRDENWPQFRGPNGDGYSDAVGLPLTWSETENVVWKTAVHGSGWSSPVVWEEQIWLTTASEDGRRMHVLCVDLASGRILRDVRLFDVAEPGEKHTLNSYASPTPAIEAGRIYAHFGTYGTACLDTSTGEVLWARRDLNCDHFRGPGSSAFLFGNLLILHYDGIDVQYLVALDKTTGKTVWKTHRSTDFGDIDGDLRKAYSTPIVIEADGRLQLISPGAKAAMAYDPHTGEELWKIRYGGFSNVSRPLFGHGLVFVNTGLASPQLWAVRPDGRGDVTDTHVVWKLRRGVPAKPSPLLVGELIYMVDDSGVASCAEAKTGQIVWQKRIGGQYSASPIYARGRIYCFSHQPKTTVLAAGRQFEILAENRLDAGFMASPAVVGKALILRTKTHLYRIEHGAP